MAAVHRRRRRRRRRRWDATCAIGQWLAVRPPTTASSHTCRAVGKSIFQFFFDFAQSKEGLAKNSIITGGAVQHHQVFSSKNADADSTEATDSAQPIPFHQLHTEGGSASSGKLWSGDQVAPSQASRATAPPPSLVASPSPSKFRLFRLCLALFSHPLLLRVQHERRRRRRAAAAGGW